MKDKKVTRNSQRGFTKGKLHLTNLIDFYYEMTVSKDKRRAVDIVYSAFSKAVDSLLEYLY